MADEASVSLRNSDLVRGPAARVSSEVNRFSEPARNAMSSNGVNRELQRSTFAYLYG